MSTFRMLWQAVLFNIVRDPREDISWWSTWLTDRKTRSVGQCMHKVSLFLWHTFINNDADSARKKMENHLTDPGLPRERLHGCEKLVCCWKVCKMFWIPSCNSLAVCNRKFIEIIDLQFLTLGLVPLVILQVYKNCCNTNVWNQTCIWHCTVRKRQPASSM